MSPRFPRPVDAVHRSVQAFAVRALAALAFVVTVLLPLRASAFIIPTCEHDAVTQMPRKLELDMSCDEAAEVALADGTPAPICDPSGASAIAPPRLLPVGDARLEAVPSCGDSTSAGPMIGPRSGEHPALTGPAIIDHATLLGGLMVPPAPFLESAVLLAPSGGPLAGVPTDVFHPPR